MPHIIVKGTSEENVRVLSETAIDFLSETLNIAPDHFTLEYAPNVYYRKGALDELAYPFITVNWFDRPEEAKQIVSDFFTGFFKRLGYDDVAVYFNALDKKSYYENGQHF